MGCVLKCLQRRKLSLILALSGSFLLGLLFSMFLRIEPIYNMPKLSRQEANMVQNARMSLIEENPAIANYICNRIDKAENTYTIYLSPIEDIFSADILGFFALEVVTMTNPVIHFNSKGEILQ